MCIRHLHVKPTWCCLILYVHILVAVIEFFHGLLLRQVFLCAYIDLCYAHQISNWLNRQKSLMSNDCIGLLVFKVIFCIQLRCRKIVKSAILTKSTIIEAKWQKKLDDNYESQNLINAIKFPQKCRAHKH